MKKISIVSSIFFKICIFTFFIQANDLSARGPWSINRRSNNCSDAKKLSLSSLSQSEVEESKRGEIHSPFSIYEEQRDQTLYDLPVIDLAPPPSHLVGEENVQEWPEGSFENFSAFQLNGDLDQKEEAFKDELQAIENFVIFNSPSSLIEEKENLAENSSDTEKLSPSFSPHAAKGTIRIIKKSTPVIQEATVGSSQLPKETPSKNLLNEASVGAVEKQSFSLSAQKNNSPVISSLKKLEEDSSLIAQRSAAAEAAALPSSNNEPLINFPGYQPKLQSNTAAAEGLPLAVPPLSEETNLNNQSSFVTPSSETPSFIPTQNFSNSSLSLDSKRESNSLPSASSFPLNNQNMQTPLENNSSFDSVVGSKRGSSSISRGRNSPLAEVSINFNNVAMIEYIRFISRISNKNFIFDDEDLQFNVTIVSEEPTSVENLMTALLQELRIRDLLLMEQGNNLIIHRNPRVRSPARVISENTSEPIGRSSELVTRVFSLNTLDPVRVAEIIRPLLSDDALIEVLRDTNHLIITDLASTTEKIAQLIVALDSPNSGVTVGQYVVINSFVDSLVELANQILQPIAQGNPFVLVPHASSNSIYIVSNAYIVEKAMIFLENLDSNEGRSKIFNLDERSRQEAARRAAAEASARQKLLNGTSGTNGLNGRPGEIEGQGSLGTGGRFGLGPNGANNGEGVHPGQGGILYGGSYPPGTRFGPDGLPLLGPNGQPIVDPNGIFPGGITGGSTRSGIFGEGGEFLPGGLSTNSRYLQEVPTGRIERTLFFIYKLRYRRGDQIEIALRRIADTLFLTGTTNADLVAAINSVQWIESSNSLVFTGTTSALERVKELILEVDVPLRQVFIEMLILDASLSDSLTYGVDSGTRFGGGNTAGGENFLATGNTLSSALSTANVFNTNAINGLTGPGTGNIGLPQADGLLNGTGFSLGIIGRHLTHNGTQFNTIGALVRAIHSDTKTNIVMNPKIITEDNNTAEIFVGETTRYKTQSIANGLGSVITNNFQFLDVGTTLRVTPLIGNNGLITLDIIEEITNGSGDANVAGNSSEADINLIPVLSKSRTTTRVHVPNGFFVVLSGMLTDTQVRTEIRLPCLGGVPILGTLFKQKANSDNKRNFMIFIRPLIVDTEEELENLTRRQQDIYREKVKTRRSWNYEIDEALDFANIRNNDPDDIGCENR